ncbi:MAG: DUF4097 family beta strand repeat protein [Phycisphaeraceae bacterium]|nr:DUF4097 family beta strand repeat protein [Phycisphaeraceae bacterium]MCW5753521.1 DUF4097 family beta strand repeat protein [Phycisphaeraceae bacterium]
MSFGRILLSALLVLIGFLPGCIPGQEARFRQSRMVEVGHVVGSAIGVETGNGEVTVVANREVASVRIVAEIRALTQERADAVQVIAQREPDGSLLISSAWPGSRSGSESCSFIIHAPDLGDVAIITKNGHIEIAGAAGNVSIETRNGRVHARSIAGSLKAHTSNGAINARDIGGPTEARTSNGSVTLTDVAGAVDARSSNGAIRVTLDDACAGPVTVATTNGSIELAFGSAFGGSVAFKTRNGRIRASDLPAGMRVPSQLNGVTLVWGPGDQSSLTTTNGAITLRSRERR